jgi:hypothetical protein
VEAIVGSGAPYLILFIVVGAISLLLSLITWLYIQRMGADSMPAA